MKSSKTHEEIESKIRERVQAVLPMFHPVAVHFADLHDTPKRMLAKGCINGIIPWKMARQQLYWRLRRRMSEEQMIKQMLDALMLGRLAGQDDGIIIDHYSNTREYLKKCYLADTNDDEVNIVYLYF